MKTYSRNDISLRPFGLARTIALFFGAGCAPRAPGTVGTLAAIPLYLLISGFSLPAYLAMVILVTLVGTWASDRLSRELGQHDHSGIVIDEVAGFLITMAFAAITSFTLVAGFLLFRFFDIVKPWPIRALDERVGGGFGIMLDDIIAGVFAGVCLWFVELYVV